MPTSIFIYQNSTFYSLLSVSSNINHINITFEHSEANVVSKLLKCLLKEERRKEGQ